MLDPQSRFWIQKITLEVYRKYRRQLLKTVRVHDDEEMDYLRWTIKKALGYGSSEEQRWALHVKHLTEAESAGDSYKEVDTNVVRQYNRELSHKLKEAIDKGLIKIPPRDIMEKYVRSRQN